VAIHVNARPNPLPTKDETVALRDQLKCRFGRAVSMWTCSLSVILHPGEQILAGLPAGYVRVRDAEGHSRIFNSRYGVTFLVTTERMIYILGDWLEWPFASVAVVTTMRRGHWRITMTDGSTANVSMQLWMLHQSALRKMDAIVQSEWAKHRPTPLG
jgi:hypothetical protein